MSDLHQNWGLAHIEAPEGGFLGENWPFWVVVGLLAVAPHVVVWAWGHYWRRRRRLEAERMVAAHLLPRIYRPEGPGHGAGGPDA